MSWEKCVKVNLNSDSTGCFYSGDIVTGVLTFYLQKERKIDTFDIEVVGISEARWSRSKPTIPYIIIYSGKKRILYVKHIDIFGSHKRGNKIPAGVYSYPFHFALPGDLPSTFKSSTANVCYYIKIKCKPKNIAWAVVPFTVIGTVNINDMDGMLTPYIFEFTKIFKRTTGKVNVQVRTYKGISPRQIIPFEIIISNEKNVKISAVHITLVQKIHYTVSSGYANEEKKISKVTCKDIRKMSLEFCKFNMEIPSIIPSSISETQPMIHISYIYRLEVCFPFHFNLYEEIPVTVASVPVIHSGF